MKPDIELLKTALLTDFPSGSSINYYEGNLYLIGDDANNLLVLDNNYKEIKSIALFDYPEKRIPKAQKADFETSTIIVLNEVACLLVLGSASTEERKRVWLIPFLDSIPDINQVLQPVFYTGKFFTYLQSKGINEVNVEGATIIGDYLVLSNRGNLTNPHNHLVFTKKDFLHTKGEPSFSISKLVLPVHTEGFAGVSELCYVESKDLLLLTLSSEATVNSYDDGTIGNSYIGWLCNISDKIQQPDLVLDKMLCLPVSDKEFENEKIEGICVESVNTNELIIHLVSDNDGGESKLFKVKLNITQHSDEDQE